MSPCKVTNNLKIPYPLMHHHPIPNWGSAALKQVSFVIFGTDCTSPEMRECFHPSLLRAADISPARRCLLLLPPLMALRLQKKLLDTRNVCFSFVFMSTGNCKEFYSIFKAHFSASVFTVAEYDSKEVLTQRLPQCPKHSPPSL